MTDPASGSVPELRARIEAWIAEKRKHWQSVRDVDLADEVEALLQVSERCECPVGWPKRGKVTSDALLHTGPCQLHDEIEHWKRIGEQVQRLAIKAQQAQEPRCEGSGRRLVGVSPAPERIETWVNCPGCVACKGES